MSVGRSFLIIHSLARLQARLFRQGSDLPRQAIPERSFRGFRGGVAWIAAQVAVAHGSFFNTPVATMPPLFHLAARVPSALRV